MTKPTPTAETFKQAALDAGARIRGGGEEGEADDRTALRKKIKEILASGEVLAQSDGVAEKVAERIALMIWPQRALEVKRAKAMLGVEQQAMNELLTKEIRDIMESMRG